jgi:hypothetical protein
MAESPESKVEPYEGLNEKQRRMTGEGLPKVTLEICDRCHWCSSCISEKGVLGRCPRCGRSTSKIPMDLDEVCYLEERSGDIVLRFDRKLPMR